MNYKCFFKQLLHKEHPINKLLDKKWTIESILLSALNQTQEHLINDLLDKK